MCCCFNLCHHFLSFLKFYFLELNIAVIVVFVIAIVVAIFADILLLFLYLQIDDTGKEKART